MGQPGFPVTHAFPPATSTFVGTESAGLEDRYSTFSGLVAHSSAVLQSLHALSNFRLSTHAIIRSCYFLSVSTRRLGVNDESVMPVSALANRYEILPLVAQCEGYIKVWEYARRQASAISLDDAWLLRLVR